MKRRFEPKPNNFFVLGPDRKETNSVVLAADTTRLSKERRVGAVSLNSKIVDDIMDYDWPTERPVPCAVLAGSKWTDYINNSFGLLFCLDSFLDVLQKTTKKSWQITPVSLLFSNGVKPPPTPVSWLRLPVGCGKLHPIGAFTPFEQTRNLKWEDHPCGVSFDLNTWNGEHLFRPHLPRGFYFITQKLADAFRATSLTGLNITPIEQYGSA